MIGCRSDEFERRRDIFGMPPLPWKHQAPSTSVSAPALLDFPLAIREVRPAVVVEALSAH
jgi:hypothetical protein